MGVVFHGFFGRCMEVVQCRSVESLPFRSPISKLLRFFCRSRDKWKAKCKAAKRENKSLKYRLAEMTESRNRWKAEVQDLRKSLQAETTPVEAEDKKPHDARLPRPPMSALATWRRCGPMIWRSASLGSSSRWAWSRAAWRWCSARGRDCSAWRTCWRCTGTGAASTSRTASYYSVRLWLLRLGLYQLSRPKIQADDWMWIMDHTMQLGERKCLIVVGIRQSAWDAQDRVLGHEDVELIDLVPVTESNGKVVYRQLQAAAAKTGVPRAIVSDGGPDLHARHRAVSPDASDHGLAVRHQAQDGLPLEARPGAGTLRGRRSWRRSIASSSRCRSPRWPPWRLRSSGARRGT